jgi:dethiobiotin synthetase
VRIFITGTDTGIGKTVTSALLLSACLQYGRAVRYWKPIQTGTDSDWKIVKELATPSSAPGPRPVYEFDPATAPIRAAEAEGTEISLSRITTEIGSGFGSDWIIEGAGGLLVPIAYPDLTMKSLAQALHADLILVASSRLGTINHTLLTLDVAKASHLRVRAIVWVGEEDPDIENFISSWLEYKVEQIRIPTASGRPDFSWVAETARAVFPPSAIERIFSV